ncbi:MAG: hypothetical protein R3F11_10840 [Verrucomicrobiales bacterium]
MSKTLPDIKIGTLAERLAASANVPLDEALAGVRAHGPQPTRPNPSIAALEYFQSLKSKSSRGELFTSSTETEPSTTPSLTPQRTA